jgi:peptide deformylase
MAILKVARLGHPILRDIVEPVPIEEILSNASQKLIDDMIDTMREYGGAGLAAPQVHESRQIVVIEVRQNERYPHAPEVPLTVLVNPQLSFLSSEMEEDWEGCLSLIDFRGRVPRYRRVRVEAYARDGRKMDFLSEGFFARAIQHECDHLMGKLFIDRMADLSSLSYYSEYLRYGSRASGSEEL